MDQKLITSLNAIMERLSPLAENIPSLYFNLEKSGEERLLFYHSEILACKQLVESVEFELLFLDLVPAEVDDILYNAHVALAGLAKYLSFLFVRESDGEALCMN